MTKEELDVFKDIALSLRSISEQLSELNGRDISITVKRDLNYLDLDQDTEYSKEAMERDVKIAEFRSKCLRID